MFADQSTATLQVLRQNLLRGLDQVAEHVDAGTLHTVPASASVSPAEFGWLVVELLRQVESELVRRHSH